MKIKLFVAVLVVASVAGGGYFGWRQTSHKNSASVLTASSTTSVNPPTATADIVATAPQTEAEMSTPRTQSKVSTSALPLGDGKVSTEPKAGYVYSCQTTFGGGGARHAGDWITGDIWNYDTKVHVEGDVRWPDAYINTATDGANRIIKLNDLPTTHGTGIFPIGRTDPAYTYDTNPNGIKAQTYSYSLPTNPTAAANPSCVPQGAIGVMLDGVVLFNALDAAGRDAAAHEVQDKCDGHPESHGAYHYHSSSACMSDALSSNLIGYALDGYGIYGSKGTDGSTISTADLDACHGTTSPVEWNGTVTNIYHYVMTADYPYSLGCYHGTPTSRR
jgi:hypothetical protein